MRYSQLQQAACRKGRATDSRRIRALSARSILPQAQDPIPNEKLSTLLDEAQKLPPLPSLAEKWTESVMTSLSGL